jgi:ceramide glucosyltransferase
VVIACCGPLALMPILILSVGQIAGVLLGVAALAYLALALRAVRRFEERPERVRGWQPSVSVLKPVHGIDRHLYECLRSFCEQDWPYYEVIFGAHVEDDPAVEVVRRLIAEFPDRDLRLVVDGTLAGPNRKAANLANIYRSARYDIIVVSDSDVRVDRDCCSSMAAPFAKPCVGAVASIYKGWAVGGAPARFGALYINDWFVPSVVVDVDLRGIDFVFGALSAVRREALEGIGGFEHLAQCLAEDFSMGRLISRKGWDVVLSTYACDTVVAERSFADMFRHEVRWQRSERACRPLDQFMSVVTCPLPLLALLLLPQPSIVGLGIIGSEMALRILLHYQLRRSFRVAGPRQPWLIPLRDCVCFFAWAAGLLGNNVYWGNEAFGIKAYRKLMSAEAGAAAESGTAGTIERADKIVG